MMDYTLVQPVMTYDPAHERQRNRRIEEVIRRSNISLTEQLLDAVLPACLVSELPASARAGVRGFVTNATSPTFGATVVAGGSVGVPVYFDGSAWRCG